MEGKGIDKKGKCLVKWEKVCKPKNAGGLGIKSLRVQNNALMMKNLYKFMNQEDIPWVKLIWQAHYQDFKLPQSRAPCGSFWWKDCLSLWNDFMELAMVKANARRTVRIWKDKWMETPAMEEFPHLFSFAGDQDCSLEKFHALRDDDIVDNFQLPLSITAGHECDELSQMLQN